MPYDVDEAVSLYVGLGRLVRTGGERVQLLRFLMRGVRVSCMGFIFGRLSVFIGGGF